MNLKDKYKKWRRRNYELSLEELEKRRKNMKYFKVFYFVFAVVLIYVGGDLLFKLVDLLSFPPTTEFTNYILVVVVIGAIVANILLIFSLHFISNLKHTSLENEFLDLMIYLKKVNGR